MEVDADLWEGNVFRGDGIGGRRCVTGCLVNIHEGVRGYAQFVCIIALWRRK